jgi:hypothetical protein
MRQVFAALVVGFTPQPSHAEAMSLSFKPARSIPLLFGLLAVVACTSKSTTLAKEICEMEVSCETSDCEESDSSEHCTIRREYYRNACFLDFGYVNDMAAHSGCSSEIQTIYSCLIEESYCDNGIFQERHDNCAKELAAWETCEEEHNNTHNGTGPDRDSGASADSGTTDSGASNGCNPCNACNPCEE